MSLVEVLPTVQSLSRVDKIRLIQFLARELEDEVAAIIDPGVPYPIWSPYQDFEAARIMLEALEQRQADSPNPR